MRHAIRTGLLCLSICFLLLLCAGLAVTAASLSGDAEPTVITTREELLSALNTAEDGATLCIGDMDLTISGTGAVNEAARITLSKSITLMGVGQEGAARLFGAGFLLDGTLVAGETTVIRFENICFDGGIDTDALTDADWQLSYDTAGEPIHTQPLKARYAVGCNGNLNASFTDCTFRNYMYAQGGAVKAYYASVYGAVNPNENCRLSLRFDNCDFTDNASTIGGGAVYLTANEENVNACFRDCRFEGNRSGLTEHVFGGGALYAQGCHIELRHSVLRANCANYIYQDDIIAEDVTQGGALNFATSTAVITDCLFDGNTASNGGALAITGGAHVTIDGCILTNNIASPVDGDPQSKYGISSGKGIGGAVFINNGSSAGSTRVLNTSVYANIAQNVEGGIFDKYSPLLSPIATLELTQCTLLNNTCLTPRSDYHKLGDSMWEWYSYPNDIYTVPTLTMRACFVIDEKFEHDFPKYECPTENNQYNYLASPTRASADGVMPENSGSASHMRPALNDAVVLSVPDAYLRTVYADAYDIYIGPFYVGDSYASHIFTPSTAEGSLVDDAPLTYTYGAGSLSLCSASREGYEFTGWTLFDGTSIENDTQILISPYAETVTLHAGFAPLPPAPTPPAPPEPLPQEPTSPLPIILSVAGALVLVAIVCAVVLFHRHRRVTAPAEIPAQQTAVTPDLSALTEREKQVLDLLLEGKGRREIAEVLFVSEETVKKHIKGIYTKLDVSTRGQLFAKFR